VTGRPKTIAVVIRTRDLHRVSEALRAAIGLGLRGDHIEVFAARESSAAMASDEPRIVRAIGTLRELGHGIVDERDIGSPDLRSVLANADAVEVWT